MIFSQFFLVKFNINSNKLNKEEEKIFRINPTVFIFYLKKKQYIIRLEKI